MLARRGPPFRFTDGEGPPATLSTASQPGGTSHGPAIVALTGFMAAGKSTVGRTLASLLQWQFIDLDSEIERRSQQTIHDIFAQRGEARFRELEVDALRSVLENVAGPTVIALGGGTFVQEQNAQRLRQCEARVVFLELDLTLLLRRCLDAVDRSAHNPRPLAEEEEAFYALYAQRLPFYRKADLVVNTEHKPAEQIAREIVERLRLAGPAAFDH